MNKQVIVVDDFLADPDYFVKLSKNATWRKGAKGLEFAIPRNISTKVCHQFADAAGIDFNFGSSNYIGSIRKTSPQKLKSDYKFRAHFDGGWNAIVYLNKNETNSGGTGFFIHKLTGLDGLIDNDAITHSLSQLGWGDNELVNRLIADENVSSRWKMHMHISSKYNRALLFNGMLFHSHISTTGKSDTRLTLNNFFGRSDLSKEELTISRRIYNTNFFKKMFSPDSY